MKDSPSMYRRKTEHYENLWVVERCHTHLLPKEDNLEISVGYTKMQNHAFLNLQSLNIMFINYKVAPPTAVEYTSQHQQIQSQRF